MISISSYKSMLGKRGNKPAYIRKSQSVEIFDNTFAEDPTYKECLILSDDGWEDVEVKYQFHVASSILKDAVDYYIEFRPGVHYKIGQYIIIPDDTSNELNLTDEELENPFLQPIENRTQWWIIVGRNDANSFVRYSVLKCNWNFKWIIDGKLQEVFGCVRNANSQVWLAMVGNSIVDLL